MTVFFYTAGCLNANFPCSHLQSVYNFFVAHRNWLTLFSSYSAAKSQNRV